MAFFELREYRTKPGMRDRWVTFMEEVIIPFQASKGMVITGSFTGQEEDDLYVWVRRFNSEEERAEQYKAVYEDEHWKTVIGPQIPEMMERSRIVVRRIEPSTHSMLR